MQTTEIVEALDAQIIKLQRARALLAGVSVPAEKVATGKRRGRPKGSVSKPTEHTVPAVPVKASKRTMSPEGKARLVAALKARWAARKKVETPAQTAADKSAPDAGNKSSKATTKAVAGRTKKAISAKI
jgi:hypothetical protein